MSRDHINKGRDRVVFSQGNDRALNAETGKAIKHVMEVIERYTDYLDLDDDRKAVVRDTVLNQINGIVRIAKRKQTMVFNKG